MKLYTICHCDINQVLCFHGPAEMGAITAAGWGKWLHVLFSGGQTEQLIMH